MKEEDFHTFLNCLAALLLFTCSCGIIYRACSCFTDQVTQTHRIVLTVSPDSVYDDAKFSYYTDSLITVINKHEHVIADRYEAILEDKADTQKYWSLAGFLVSVIVGIAGFFGFKSIKDIEHDCKETAEEIAASKAASVASATSKEITQKYLDDNLKKEVLDASRDYFGDREQLIREMVRKAVTEKTAGVSDVLENLTKQLDEIEDRLERMEVSKELGSPVTSSDTSDSANHTTISSVPDETDLFS